MEQELFVRPGDDLQRVFDAAAPGTRVVLSAGEYRQKIMLSTPGLTVTGAGAARTALVFDDYAKKPDARGRESGTFRTWTLAVCADGVTVRELSVVNDALRPEAKGQEVALSVCGDGFSMEDCVLSSTQDTLFLGPLPADLRLRYDDFLAAPLRRGGPLRQRFARCRIEGTVDFIFGCGDALFEDCELRSLPDARGTGYVAAPAHSVNQDAGFVFRRCAFTCAGGVRAGSVYLARPWREYGLARFERCAYGPHIAPAGFDKWNGTDRNYTARFYETPPVAGRVPWVRPG